jgi:MFS family permease
VREKLHRNIHAIYGLAFFHSFMVLVPVIVPFFMSKGLSLADIFYLQAIFAANIVILEAPSGYFADLLGRRTALLIGSVAHGVAYFLLNFANDMSSLIVFEIVAGIAASLLSGADLAVLYDTQKALQGSQNNEHSKAIANLGFVRSGAEGWGALLGGALVLWSFELMILVQSALAWACFVLALQLVEPPYRDLSQPQKRVQIMGILKHLLAGDPVLRKVVIAIPLYNLASFHVAWLMQPFWESRGISLAWFGLLWFSQSLTVAAANKFGFRIERRHGAVFSLCLIAVLPVIGHFGMAWIPGWLGLALGLLIFVGRGLNQVILVNALNRRVPSEFRASANSFTSFLFRLSFISTGPLVGYIAQTQGLETALILLGLASLALFFLVMLPLIQSVRNIQQRVIA